MRKLNIKEHKIESGRATPCVNIWSYNVDGYAWVRNTVHVTKDEKFVCASYKAKSLDDEMIRFEAVFCDTAEEVREFFGERAWLTIRHELYVNIGDKPLVLRVRHKRVWTGIRWANRRV